MRQIICLWFKDMDEELDESRYEMEDEGEI